MRRTRFIRLTGVVEKKDMARILIADHNASLRKSLANLLRCQGYSVCEVENGLQATCCGADSFDMVIMGVHMSPMDGWEACRQLRARSKVPILMMSTAHFLFTAEQVAAWGANALLPKSTEPRQLLASVATLCNQGNESRSPETA